MHQIVHPHLFAIFSPPEVQVLLSGMSSDALDIQDLKQNTKYSGGYLESLDLNIQRFWRVVEREMSEEQRRKLLRFVTLCERAPSLGFSSLNPPFTIQMVPGDDTKLPSASTCFNTLKLPAYSSEGALKRKLIYAIESNSGFDLS